MKWKFSRGLTCEIRKNKTTTKITTYMYSISHHASNKSTDTDNNLPVGKAVGILKRLSHETSLLRLRLVSQLCSLAMMSLSFEPNFSELMFDGSRTNRVTQVGHRESQAGGWYGFRSCPGFRGGRTGTDGRPMIIRSWDVQECQHRLVSSYCRVIVLQFILVNLYSQSKTQSIIHCDLLKQGGPWLKQPVCMLQNHIIAIVTLVTLYILISDCS